jgi:eukaryotic-like serine/threonine-protein kinase
MTREAASATEYAGRPLPTRLFGYDVVDFIGEGAGSIIYAVSDPVSGQVYALKHVVRKSDRHVRFIQQLENEYEIARQFTHAGLRRAIDMKHTRTLFLKVTEAVLVMEMFDGTPLELAQALDAMGVLDTFIKVAEALGAMHAMGYIHCDLKPNNILINGAGDVKVIDFGQACKSGTVKERIQGTPDYIAPEQVRREPVTVRTDVFNFGATLYWATAGRTIPTLYKINKGDNSFLVDDRILSPRDLNGKIPETLSNLVMECIRTNPAKRPHDMNEVARRLDIIRHGLNRAQAAAKAG